MLLVAITVILLFAITFIIIKQFMDSAHASAQNLSEEDAKRLQETIEQSEQVFVGLKSLGIDSEFVRFPNEFHGLSRTGRTDRRISRLNHIIGWFEKYLK